MAIGIADEHEELRQSLRKWVESRCPSVVTRTALEADSDELPGFWTELGTQGYLGMNVGEECGGQGAGLLEWAVVAEELGRAAAPGPWGSTVLAAAVVSEMAELSTADAMLPGLAAGSIPAAVVVPTGAADGSALPVAGLIGEPETDVIIVSGTIRPVVNGGVAALLVAPVAVGDGTAWMALRPGPGVSVEAIPSFDPSRRSASWTFDRVAVPRGQILGGANAERIRDLAVALASAEAVGGAQWCLDTATEHARNREQFGRPIGQFQGVKHRLADMLVSVEQAVAATWDAVRVLDRDGPESGTSATAGETGAGAEAGTGTGTGETGAGTGGQGRMAARVAGALALDAYVEAAKGTIQVLGGTGFTWEHDAHIHLRRSITLRQMAGGTAPMRAEAARLAVSGCRRNLSVDLPREAERLADTLAPVVEAIAAMADPAEQRRQMADTGLLAPHWPAPWGRDAGPVEQLVIDQLCARAGLHRPNLAVAAWALPTIIAHGTADQTDRWVLPTLRGELEWCQLFSEPGAGSDLAALRTRATRAEGGWSLSGQKVWTSVAARAHMGICLARTNPDAPKHQGITYFLVDMSSPGVEIRPLREITGDELFNEVFFDECFVPDDCVVGEVDGGWRLARTTLANERVSLSSGSALGGSLEAAITWLSAHPDACDPVTLDRLGGLVADAQSLALLGVRATLRSVGGLQPGPESSVRKLVGAEFEQRVHEFGLDVLGPDGVTTDREGSAPAYGLLQSRCLTIAGGTSEVQRNVIGERLLGLPRDPDPGR